MSNRARLLARHNLTASAAKVYAVVPMREAWTSEKIYQELRRQGVGMQYEVAHGCLRKLTQDDLVREKPHNHYQRIEIFEESDNVATSRIPSVVEPIKPAPSLVKEATLLSRLAEVSSKLRAVANEIDEIALDVEADQGANAEAAKKLAILKAALS